MRETSITLDGRTYLVTGEGRGATVSWVQSFTARVGGASAPATMISPVKHGSAIWKVAVQRAAYERSLSPSNPTTEGRSR